MSLLPQEPNSCRPENKVLTLPEPNPEPLRTIYNALPDDVKRKVSLHDLKRINDALVPEIEPMVERFLTWKLPRSVRPDGCVMDQDYPYRTGTNLLTATEARMMVEHMLTPS